jgi:hypothetical protein
VISCKYRKQATVSLSSTEAKYQSLSDSCKEGLWLRHLLTEIQLRPDTAIPLHIDNEGAEALAKNPKHHARTKHIQAQYHFIRECVQDQEVHFFMCPPMTWWLTCLPSLCCAFFSRKTVTVLVLSDTLNPFYQSFFSLSFSFILSLSSPTFNHSSKFLSSSSCQSPLIS